MGGRSARGRLAWVGLGVALLVGLAGRAEAVVEGTTPARFQTFRLFGDARPTGNTLMSTSFGAAEHNTILLPSSTASLGGIPLNAEIESAFLFWSGSLTPPGFMGPTVADTNALFTLSDGVSTGVNADMCRTINAVSFNFDFYYCRSDITGLLRAHPGSFRFNGSYTVAGVEADPAHVMIGPGGAVSCVAGDVNCQAKYAAWTMVVVYSSPTATVQRDILLYDGFVHLDETLGANGAGITTFTLDGFLVGTPALAEISYFAMEGDARLGGGGVQPGCPECWDFFALNGVDLTDGANPPKNVMNSTPALGFDLDTFNVGTDGGGQGILTTGATSVMARVGAGDGVPSANGGGGESFLLGWTLLRLNRPSPNFQNPNTNKISDPPEVGPGGELVYIINVSNGGSQDASGVVMSDPLPAGVTANAATIRVGGVPCAAGQCSVVGNRVNVNLGAMPFAGAGQQRQITFRVTVDAGAVAGTQLCNTAEITSVETPTPATTNTSCSRVVAPTIGTPTKRDADLNGGVTGPGDVVQYTITIPGDPSGVQAAGIRLIDDMPAHMQLLSVIGPAGSVDNSTLTGGANGRGRVDLGSITVGAGVPSVQVIVTAQVDDEAEWAPVVPDAIDGQVLCNQGTVTAPFLMAAVMTDDPDTGAAADGTCTTITYRPSMAASGKSVVDDDGGLLEPLDTLTYTITLRNDGNRTATVDLTDSMPAGVGGFMPLTAIFGATFEAAPAGSNMTGRLLVPGIQVPANGGMVVIRFRVTVEALVADGTVVQNLAQMEVLERPAESRVLASQALTVFARPLLTTFDKSVVDVNGGSFEPGDVVRYTLAVTNTGNRPATAAQLTDVVDANLTAVTPASGGVFDAGTRTITWAPGDIAVGATVTVGFEATIVTPLANGTTIANQGAVRSVEVTTPELSNDPATGADNDPTVIVVVAAPNLSGITKTVTDLKGAPVRPGDTLEYTVSVTNTGTANATGVVLRDPLPATLTDVVSTSAGCAHDAGSNTITCMTDVAAGATFTLSFTARVVQPIANGTEIDNQATIRSNEVTTPELSDDPTTAAVDDPTRVVVVATAVLTADKAVEDANGGAAQPGDELRYTLTLTNSGDGIARNVQVTDMVDARLEMVVAEDGGTAGPGTVGWTLAAVNPGTPVVVHFRARLRFPLPNGDVVCNQASAESVDLPAAVLTDDPATAAALDPTCVTVESRPELTASTKTVAIVGGGAAAPGATVRYTLAAVNSGTQDATAVVVTDVVDANLGDVMVEDGGSFDAGTRTITWTLPVVAARGQAEVHFTAVIASPLDDGTLIPNQGSLVSAELPIPALTDDPTTAGLDDPTIITVGSNPVFATTTKAIVDDDGPPFEPGDSLTYTITVTNTGTSEADNVVVSDVVDTNLVNVVVADGGSFDAGTRTITWNAAGTPALTRVGVGAAAQVVLTFRAEVVTPLDDGVRVCNQARITSDEVTVAALSDDPRTPALGDSTCFANVSGPDFTGLTKTVTDVNGAPARPRDTVRYTLGFTNLGNANGRNVVVRDAIPAGLTDVMATGGRVVGTEIVWDAMSLPALANVAVGATVTLEFTAVIASPLDDGTVISNQASLTDDTVTTAVLSDDPATLASDDPTRFTVTSTVTIGAVTKTVVDENAGVIAPGDSMRYTITVPNTGDAVARGVVVTDVVSASFAAVTPEDGGVFDATSRTVTWNVGDLSPGMPRVLHFRARLVTPLANGTVVSNQATVNRTGGMAVLSDDPATPAPADPTRFTVVAAPNLGASEKTAAGAMGGVVVPGATVTYSIRVRNTGDDTATMVTVRDTVPAELENVMVLDGGSFDAATRVARWTIATVAAGGETMVRVSGRVRGDVRNGIFIDNQAFLASAQVLTEVPTDDPATPAVDDVTRLTVSAIPVLTDFTKAVVDDNGGRVAPGDFLTYTLTLTVPGPAHAFDVVVTDPIPAALDMVTATQGGTVSATQVVWNRTTTPALADVAPGVPVVLTFRGRVRAGTLDEAVISNQARVTATAGTQEPSDDPATATLNDPTRVSVVARPELEQSSKVARDDNGGVLLQGDTLTYTITIANTGTASALMVRLRDTIPSGTTYVARSTRVRGAVIGDGAGGVAPLIAGQLIGTVAAGERIEVSFQVRVSALTPVGFVIANQGTITGQRMNGVGLSVLTDDPRTPMPSDATLVVVGGGAILRQFNKVFDPRPVNDDGDGLFEVGEGIHYRLTWANAGDAAATEVRLTDVIPNGTTYVPLSMRLNGRQLTDAVDADEGVFAGGRLVVTLPRAMNVGDQLELEFDVRIAPAGGGQVINQATIDSRETPPEESDADGDDSNGNQATVTTIGAAATLTVTKTAIDLDGGEVEAGDVLEYVLHVKSNAAMTLSDVDVLDLLPTEVQFLLNSQRHPAGGMFIPPGAPGSRLQVAGLTLEPGATADISFQARIGQQVEAGTSICNTGEARGGGAGSDSTVFKSDPVCVLVGSAVGLGGISGRVFQDVGARDRVFQPDTATARGDEALGGFQVQLWRGDEPGAELVGGAIADSEGKYELGGIAPGNYRVRVLSGPTVYQETAGVRVPRGDVGERDLLVDPSGRVYDSSSGAAVVDAQAFLFFDAEETEAALRGQLVPDADLLPGQQGQRTNGFGMYRFDVRAGRRYRLELRAPGTSLVFPSSVIPAQGGLFDASSAGHNEVSPFERVELTNDLMYFLRFQIDGPEDEVLNNHVPMDPAASLIRLDKRADRAEAAVGDIITYTVTVVNRSTASFTDAILEDVPARGLTPIGGRAVLTDATGTRRVEPTIDSGGRARFAGLALPAGATITVAYQAIVGLDTRQGSYENRAWLSGPGGVPLSNEDTATVRVINDPLFDEALVIGKVFCDADKDGKHDAGERGVAGARVYVDTGSYAVTDRTGKYHLSQLEPGLHLLKLDVATVPPGSKTTTPELARLYLTRGLGVKQDFGVACVAREVTPETPGGYGSLRLKQARASTRPARPRTSVTVSGSVGEVETPTLEVLVDGELQQLVGLELGLTPAPAPAPGGPSTGAPPPSLNLPVVPLAGYGDKAPLFTLAKTGRAVTARGWTISIHQFDPAGTADEVVRVIAGEGEPPAQVTFDGLGDAGAPLARNATYYAELEVVADEAGSLSTWISARVPFAIALGVVDPPSRDEVLAAAGMTSGKLVKPTKKLKQAAAKVAGGIAADEQIVVEGHSDGRGDRIAQLVASQKLAEAGKAALLAAGVPGARIKAVGRGGSEPLLPGTGAKARKKNQRIVFRMTAPPPPVTNPQLPPPAPRADRHVIVGGDEVLAGQGGRFVRNLAIPADGRLLIDVTASNGARAAFVVVVAPELAARQSDPGDDVELTLAAPAGAPGTAWQASLAGTTLDLGLMGVDLSIGNQPVPNFAILPARGKGKKRKPAELKAPVVMALTQPLADVSRWGLTVRRGDGSVAYETGGQIVPPAPTWSWDGRDDSGALVLAKGQTYTATLEVEDTVGSRGLSPARAFTVGAPKKRPRSGPFRSIAAAGKLFNGKAATPAGKLKSAIAAFKQAVKVRPLAERYTITLRIEPGPKVMGIDRMTAVGTRLVQLKKALAKAKLPAARFDVDAALVAQDPNALEPMAPRPAKDELTITAVPESGVARATINGAALEEVATGAYTHKVHRAAGAATVIELGDREGHRAILLVQPPVRATDKATPPADPNSVAPPGPTSNRVDPDNVLQPDWSGKSDLKAPPFGPGRTASGASTAGTGPELKTPVPFAEDGPLVPDWEHHGSDLKTPSFAAAGGVSLKSRSGSSIIIDPTVDGALDEAFGDGVAADPQPKVAAANLTVRLPPEGIPLDERTLAVEGTTEPGNVITINGAPVEVGQRGRWKGTFSAVITLPLGASTVVVTATDKAGNVGEVRWPVVVKETRHFLLALADTAMMNQGVELDGMNGDTTTRLGPVKLHGRAALYYKGRIKGGALFKQYFITAHLDTAKRARFEEMYDELIDANRQYAIYGDSAQEVRDAQARGKLYLLVEADDSKALVGNFRTSIEGLELIKFDRAVYGASIDLKKSLLKGKLKQTVKLFGSLGDGRLVHARDVYRSTGGSLYYLRGQHVLESSERVRVIVRDRDSGAVIEERTLARYSDYTLDYAAGRILLKDPLASTLPAGAIIGNPVAALAGLDGNPVYLEIDYEHEPDSGGGGKVWGAYAREEVLGGKLVVGGGGVGERRDGTDLSVVGADVTWAPTAKTRVRAELAQSRGSDRAARFSPDGGLSFLALDVDRTLVGADESSLAWKLDIKTDLGLSKQRKKLPDWFDLHLYAQDFERGFAGSGASLDSGRSRWGGALAMKLSKRDTLTLKSDYLSAELPRLSAVAGVDPLSTRSARTALSTLTWTGQRGKDGKYGLKGELSHLWSDGLVQGAGSTDRIGLGFELGWQASKRWHVTLSQSGLIPEGDESAVNTLTTRAGAEMAMTKGLAFTMAGAATWNGDTSAEAGLRVKLSPTASTYVKQRVTQGAVGVGSSTIVGAEDQFGVPGTGEKLGRTYGEYQLESGALGLRNKALLGIGNKKQLTRHLAGSLSFEHQQTFGSSLPDGTALGDQSRDMLSLGWELKYPRLKAGGRAEMRLDDGAGPVVVGTSALEDPRLSGTYADRSPQVGAPLVLPDGERLQLLSTNAATFQWSEDLSFLARFNLSRTTLEDATEAHFVEASFGFALRPLANDWLNLLGQYTKLYELRPVGVAGGVGAGDTLHDDRESDVLSIMPILDMPWRLQLTEKLAWKRVASDMEFGNPLDPAADPEVLRTITNTVLWLNRVAFHVTRSFDVAVEYRFMWQTRPGVGGDDATQLQHGALLELDALVAKHVRVGVGWNFTRFSDDELSDLDRDASGFFVRVTGQY
ncbi:MAG: DUF11 domain-containing protein [Deltaproteobacteria bacterium]|nr:DUF11 domain-containing protein [Deltaproteobacteria bacterium]